MAKNVVDLMAYTLCFENMNQQLIHAVASAGYLTVDHPTCRMCSDMYMRLKAGF